MKETVAQKTLLFGNSKNVLYYINFVVHEAEIFCNYLGIVSINFILPFLKTKQSIFRESLMNSQTIVADNFVFYFLQTKQPAFRDYFLYSRSIFANNFVLKR